MKFTAVSLLAAASSVVALQLPIHFGAGDALAAADAAIHLGTTLSPISTGDAEFSMKMIGEEEHVTFTSHKFPKHQLRIKSTDGWCDPDVKSYTGYLDVGYGKDLFFYFFESRSKPAEDPVLMWINGGPGCSSALGLFMELGPCSVTDATSINGTKKNPHSWNNNANVFFIDEPINVGFSYSKHGQHVATTEQAAVDIQAFVTIFFETFKEFEGRAFHMAGESYGGRYLPLFASAVLDGNRHLKHEGKKPINLQSVMIGNGITSSFETMKSYFPYTCTKHSNLTEPLLPISTCVQMADNLPRCSKMLQKACLDTYDAAACGIAFGYCESVVEGPFFGAGVNPYDVSKPCTLKELEDSLCYSVTDIIGKYLDQPAVREHLGVDPSRGNFSSCDGRVGIDFSAALDSAGHTWLYVAGLLEHGVRVLNYVGTWDWICNFIGNEAWVNALEWTGQEGFQKAEMRDWIVEGKAAGATKSHGGLTFAKVEGAGHMVPYDKPVEALAMLQRWLAEKDL